MKSLLSIIEKLSQQEIGAFRQFISQPKRGGTNKKLELFNSLVKGNRHHSNQTPFEGGKKTSRQSLSQLKKRLKEDLYSFLISQHQVKKNDEKLFLEMDCHKKLYCFKILIDKGIQAPAQHILDEILAIATKYRIQSIYLEALSLKNIYFPLRVDSLETQIQVNSQIDDLKQKISRDFYINRYLSQSLMNLHEDDKCFRKILMDDLPGEEIVRNESTLTSLRQINGLFYQGDFHAAYARLKDMVEDTEQTLSKEAKMQGLVYIELVKSCICIGSIQEAKMWVGKAERILREYECFLCVIMELKFIICLRLSDVKDLQIIIRETRQIKKLGEDDSLTARWSFYSVFLHYQKREFKQVIKSVNSHPIAILKNKSWIIVIKMLELLSIYQLNDVDWLYYKVESLRKIINGMVGKYQRFNQIMNLMKCSLLRPSSSQVDIGDKIERIEEQFPWHPLSNELINFCTCLHQLTKTGRCRLSG